MLAMDTVNLSAQTFNVLHTFTCNPDGCAVQSGLFLSGDTLYGTTIAGGPNGYGTLYSINTNGNGFNVIYAIKNSADGSGPSSLILLGNTLYGTSDQGGTNYGGTVFSVSISNHSLTTLHTFNGWDGIVPAAGLVASSGRLYGTTESGGSNTSTAFSSSGTVFSMSTNGSDYKVLHNFTDLGFSPQTNSDGAHPKASLLISGDTLYGTAAFGGTNASGTVFSINTNGTGFTMLHNFTGGNGGASPQANLVLSDGTLYGTTRNGGTNNVGTVFSINTNGSGFSVLHAFASMNSYGNNLDGASPVAGLSLSGDMLFGIAHSGGDSHHGTIFMLKTNGSGFMVLHNFSGGADGSDPESGLIFSGNTLFGTAYIGGANGSGTVFGLTIFPDIKNFSLDRTNIIINAIKGLAGHSYTVLTSTNTTLPISYWIPVTTNRLSSGGDFSIIATNAVNREAFQQFYILETQ